MENVNNISSRTLQRLFLNNGGYRGEGIDIDAVLRETGELALANGWESVPMSVSGANSLPAFQRLVAAPRQNLYISSGIHGDEPAGPLAVLELFRANHWPADLNLWVVPCLNPAGFRLGRREDENGVDLNRDYRSRTTDAVRAHIAWLEERPRFNLSLLLHEDWESHGFYLYELNPDHLPSFTEPIIAKVKDVCPVDLSPVIEGREAQGGVICANADLPRRTDWPEAFYLIHHKTRINYTFESPSDFPLAIRTQALVAGVQAVCATLERSHTG